MQRTQGMLLGLIVFGVLAVLTSIASAQISTTANGPYYATPSWDQKLTTNRFVILANWNGEAVLDRETGLVWERVPSTVMLEGGPAANVSGGTYAQEHCFRLAKGGRSGWRLPSAHELLSLLDPSEIGVKLPAGHPFTLPPPTPVGSQGFRLVFWTSSDYYNRESLRIVNFLLGGGTGSAGWGLEFYAWCVRGN